MQQRLFSTSELFPFRRFKKLFSFLPYPLFENKTYGRRPYPKEAILKAFIYGGLRRLNTLSEISFELSNNMNVAEDMGFNILRPLPSVERFSAFLQDKDNILLQSIRNKLVHKLIECNLIKGGILSIDSCPIISPV